LFLERLRADQHADVKTSDPANRYHRHQRQYTEMMPASAGSPREPRPN